ncbi:glutamate-rich protein 6B isoform X2 [Lithobates pipiens]
MDNKSKEHHQGQTPSHSTLTVENVTKLELHYDSVDGDLRKVEEYIRKSQHFDQQRSVLSSHPIPQPEEDFKKSGTGTAEDSSLDGKEKKMQIYSDTKKKSKVPVATTGRKPLVNTDKCQYKSVQTQTEWSLSTLSPAISGNGLTETENRHAMVSAASSLKSRANDSVTIETPPESKSVDSEDGEVPGSPEITLSVEEYPQREVGEDLVSCDFCLKPKKPFPSVEQVISEPSGMLFCCVKSQKLFQFMIMDTIKTHTPEETNEKIEILTKEAEDKNEVKEREFEGKNSDDSPPTTLHSSEDIKALNTLREELEKVNAKEYITSLSNHLISYGSLFVTKKITFSLESTNDSITYMQSAAPDFQMVPNIDDFFLPVLDSGTIKMPEKIVSECYNSGSSFLILFTDGTGQVLYPSGNIGILIARSKSAQLTFIVMEDTKHKPQIQAVFMSNGHAACYHLNGSF